MDQGSLGSCTAHGITSALRFELLKRNEPDVPLSRLQLYYDERKAEGTIESDAGAEIRDGIKCASKIGVAPEKDWSYQISKFDVKPPAKCYKDAKKFRALEYKRVEVSISSVKNALASGHPVVIGVTLYESFESLSTERTGVVKMPEKKEQIAGGHCMYVVGYGQRKGYFTVRNSWAKDWGDKGDCYMPEAYIGSRLLGADYWVITTEGSA
jgi:C1A family cysteine protease